MIRGTRAVGATAIATVAIAAGFAPAAASADEADVKRARLVFQGSWKPTFQTFKQSLALTKNAVRSCEAAEGATDPDQREQGFKTAKEIAEANIDLMTAIDKTLTLDTKDMAKAIGSKKNLKGLSKKREAEVEKGVGRLVAAVKELQSAADKAADSGFAVRDRDCGLADLEYDGAAAAMKVADTKYGAGLDRVGP